MNSTFPEKLCRQSDSFRRLCVPSCPVLRGGHSESQAGTLEGRQALSLPLRAVPLLQGCRCCPLRPWCHRLLPRQGKPTRAPHEPEPGAHRLPTVWPQPGPCSRAWAAPSWLQWAPGRPLHSMQRGGFQAPRVPPPFLTSPCRAPAPLAPGAACSGAAPTKRSLRPTLTEM